MNTKITIGTELKHKHINAFATVLDFCENGSLKVIMRDLSAPNSKLRKPKTYYIQKDDISQWTVVPSAGTVK